jgi:hypothetical protein
MAKRTIAAFVCACGIALMGQSNEPAPVFTPALDQIQTNTRIPILLLLLPLRLPSAIPAQDSLWSAGTVTNDGYFVALYFSETGVDATSRIGVDANFAAGLGGSTLILKDLPNTRRIALSGGRTAIFRPISCKGSCAPANLWWERNGVTYQIQAKLRSSLTENDQPKILVEMANSTVTVRQR